jgi:osmotically-inducible protein OsmY
MKDIHLRSHVLNELAFEPSLDAARIGVSVDEGIVTLTGQVASYAEKLAAEAATGRVRGVRAIAEEISIIPPESRCTDDAELARQALCMIEWDAQMPKGAVKVKVENGWVTLSGELNSYFQRRRAADAVQKLRCVKGVTNQINMRPDAGAKDVESRILAVLKRNSQLSGHDIHAKVFGGTVTLDGGVNCLHARELAERAAWGVPGVQWVDNHLTVGPMRGRAQVARPA